MKRVDHVIHHRTAEATTTLVDAVANCLTHAANEGEGEGGCERVMQGGKGDAISVSGVSLSDDDDAEARAKDLIRLGAVYTRK